MNEAELRAALHDGEGESPDVTTVLATARVAQRQRRVRLGSAAAAAVAVAAVGVGSAFAFGGNSGSDNPAAAHGVSAAPSGGATLTPQLGEQPPPGPFSAAAMLACPASAPHTQLPRQPTRLSGTAPLFPDSVAAVKLCAYASSGHPLGSSREIDGSAGGSQLAQSMEHAAAQQPAYKCASDSGASAAFLVVIAVDRDGSPMPPVTAHVTRDPCAEWITNGVAVRYAWAPPTDLWQRLLHPAGTPPAEPNSSRKPASPRGLPTTVGSSAPTAGSGSAPSGRATVPSSPPPTLNRGSPAR